MRRVKIERGERETVRRILCRMISIGGTVRLDCILQLGTRLGLVILQDAALELISLMI